jgi:Ca2+-binding EF-hand superfamily protein/antitoxin component of RelBE/YafQ-DinJ toxin-antitoxin module
MPENLNGQASRSPKKTEMIEVRVSHETKRAFLEACGSVGRTASDVIRESIDDFIDQRRQPQPVVKEEAAGKVFTLIPRAVRKKRYVAVGAAAVGLSLFAALPSAAAPDLAAAFKRLDTNGDGVLTDAEFGKRENPGAKRMGLRILRQTPSTEAEREADRAQPKIFLVPPPADGKPISELMRDVNLRGIGIPTASEESAAKYFAAFDADKNGSVDMTEFLARQRLMLANGFAKLDKDGNGGLDASEYSALGRSFVLYPPDAILELGVAAKGGRAASPATLEAEFAKHDADKDGKLSLEEYLPSN